MWFKTLYAILLSATAGFPWYYSQPLASDLPMHMALAKVYADYLLGLDGAGSPYRPYFTLSSYELPELMLVPLILAFGIDSAWKIALSLYGFFFPLAVGFMVGKVNPAARWTRLAGFPLALGYFFHWGFWPFLVGFVFSVWATALSIGRMPSAIPRPIEIVSRLLTFLSHPIPAFAVGLFDIVRLSRHWPRSSAETWRVALQRLGFLLLLWFPSGLVILFMLGHGVEEGGFRWVNLPSQLVQLLRPFYLTRQWYEFALPLAFAAALTYKLWRRVDLRSERGLLLTAGLVCTVVGLIIPRGRFMGSWENGARVILYGFILVAASWALIERESKALILGWVLTGSAINIAGSHRLWLIHEPSFDWAMDTLDRHFRGFRIIERGAWTGDSGIALGNNLPTWAWCKGIAADARNVAGIRRTGPAIYSGLSPERRAGLRTVVLYYHPYRRSPALWEQFPEPPVLFDSKEIYSLQERLGPEDLEDEHNPEKPGAGAEPP